MSAMLLTVYLILQVSLIATLAVAYVLIQSKPDRQRGNTLLVSAVLLVAIVVVMTAVELALL